jgi:hypothetical protein
MLPSYFGKRQKAKKASVELLVLNVKVGLLLKLKVGIDFRFQLQPKYGNQLIIGNYFNHLNFFTFKDMG